MFNCSWSSWSRAWWHWLYTGLMTQETASNRPWRWMSLTIASNAKMRSLFCGTQKKTTDPIVSFASTPTGQSMDMEESHQTKMIRGYRHWGSESYMEKLPATEREDTTRGSVGFSSGTRESLLVSRTESQLDFRTAHEHLTMEQSNPNSHIFRPWLHSWEASSQCLYVRDYDLQSVSAVSQWAFAVSMAMSTLACKLLDSRLKMPFAWNEGCAFLVSTIGLRLPMETLWYTHQSGHSCLKWCYMLL